jgi:hypothetical protein
MGFFPTYRKRLARTQHLYCARLLKIILKLEVSRKYRNLIAIFVSKVPHASIPHNPLIAEPMFLATYAEKAGSSILDMIKLCRVAGVRAPEFRQDGGQFVQTLWRPKAVVAVQSDQHSRPTRSAIQSIINQGKAHEPSVGWNVRSLKPATLPHGVHRNCCRFWVMPFAQETSSAV